MQAPDSNTPIFHIGELRIAQLPKDKFAIDSWTIGDRFMTFISQTFLMVLENLIQEGIILYEAKPITTKVFLFHRERICDYVRLNPNYTSPVTLGSLENALLQDIKQNPSTAIRDCLNRVFHVFLEGTTKTNPAKAILLKIIEMNLFRYWVYEESFSWFSPYMKVLVDPASKSKMIALLDQTTNRISTMKQQSGEFEDLSKRLKKIIDQRLQAWMDST